MSAAGDEEDELLLEVPVFLNKRLRDSKTQLSLLQFPIEQTARMESVVDCRVKPGCGKLEISCDVPRDNDTYDVAHGIELARQALGPFYREATTDADVTAKERRANANYMDDDDYGAVPVAANNAVRMVGNVELPRFTKGRYDRCTLTSTEVPMRASYAIGRLTNKELHVTPLDRIVQMRPSFTHIDAHAARLREEDKKKRAQQSETSAATVHVDDDDEADGALQVQFERRETERAQKARKRSYAYLRQQEIDEPWTEVQLHDRRDDEEASDTQMFAHDTTTQLKSDVSPIQFLDRLFPPRARDGVTLAGSSSGGGSSSSAGGGAGSSASSNELLSPALKSLSVKEQVRRIMRTSHVIRFEDIVARVPRPKDKDVRKEIFAALADCAWLVQGAFVLQSALLFERYLLPPANASAAAAHVQTMPSESQGLVSAALMRDGRDYMLACFAASPTLERKDLACTRLPAEDILHMLKSVSVLERPARVWRFSHVDATFEREHEAHCHKETQRIRERGVELHRHMVEALAKRNPGSSFGSTISSSSGGKGKRPLISAAAQAAAMQSGGRTRTMSASTMSGNDDERIHRGLDAIVAWIFMPLDVDGDGTHFEQFMQRLASRPYKAAPISDIVAYLECRNRICNEQPPLLQLPSDPTEQARAVIDALPSFFRVIEHDPLPSSVAYYVPPKATPLDMKVRTAIVESMGATGSVKKTDLQATLKELDASAEPNVHLEVVKEYAEIRGMHYKLRALPALPNV